MHHSSVTVDLHMHTNCSDGVLSPASLVHLAHDRGLGVIAITDHDTVNALPEALEAGEELGIEIIAGVELSVDVLGKELHLLGYFFDPDDADLRSHLEKFRKDRKERAYHMVERLQQSGINLSMQEVEAQAQGDVLARPHIAKAMLQAGIIQHEEEAYQQYIGDNSNAFVQKNLPSVEESVDLLHRAGGIGVLAHPGHWVTDRQIKRMCEAGLDGIETVHPAHDEMLVRYYRQKAIDLFLAQTGGSDFHGSRESDLRHLGEIGMQTADLERLKRRFEIA